MNNKPKILLIDDEPDILQIVGIMLTSEGFVVTKADCGEEALKIMATESFDMVISDYLMPKMDGIDVLKNVRARGDHTSFLFFSGNADETQELKMSGLGAFKLVAKTELLALATILRDTIKKDCELREIRMDKTQESKDFLKLLNSAS